MATDITCIDCGEVRPNAAYKNTKYCVRCRLIRDLDFIGNRKYECDVCDAPFAPISRSDSYCGGCSVGCGKYLPCVLCGDDPHLEGYYELHRPGLPVCVRCVRDPAKRAKVKQALRRGQHQARVKNGLAEPATQQPSTPAKPARAYDLLPNRGMIALKKRHPKSPSESNFAYVDRLIEAGVLTVNPDRSLKEVAP